MTTKQDDDAGRSGSALERGVRPWSETHPIWLAFRRWDEAGAGDMAGAFAALGAAVEDHTARAVAAERERCATVCRDLWDEQEAAHGNRAGEYHNGLTAGLDLAERRIRLEA